MIAERIRGGTEMMPCCAGFTFGQADRSKTSASYREILDAMWLFNDKFEQALARYNEIKAQKKG